MLLSTIAVFSPIAGLLSDVKFSRYEVVVCSSCAIIVELLVSPFIIAVEYFFFDALYQAHVHYTVRNMWMDQAQVERDAYYHYHKGDSKPLLMKMCLSSPSKVNLVFDHVVVISYIPYIFN